MGMTDYQYITYKNVLIVGHAIEQTPRRAQPRWSDAR